MNIEYWHDQSREIVVTFDNGDRLYHVVNAGGDEMSVLTDKNGDEIGSCYPDHEADMLKHFGHADN